MSAARLRIPAISETTRERHAGLGWPVALAGALLLIAGTFLSWSLIGGVLGDLSIDLYPGVVQITAIALAALAVAFLLVEKGPLARAGRWVDGALAVRALGTGSLAYMVLTGLAIGSTTGSILNVNPGYLVSLVGALLLWLGGRFLPQRLLDPVQTLRLPAWLEILSIAALMLGGLFAVAHALDEDDEWMFGLFLLGIAVAVTALARSGLGTWFSGVSARHRPVLLIAAFLAAIAFPFTQNGSNANMSIATQVLIFAATAIGLNIVVGLAGLLDLGYIAFLGSGAYVAAMLSGSIYATIGWNPPFVVTALIGACVAAVLGLVIGSPTLRVSGDYLAIVTLAFGEIFRLAMFNLDGTNGPDLTNGPNGIGAIPDLRILGIDFGASWSLFGVPMARYANYYFLLLLLIAFIVLVFSRLNNSRIGRGWVAIREDEKAAEAMGVNVFGLKLLAFAGGAFLAGLAGTIKAHHDSQVSPDQYVFLESAFLLAAVVLGGMGTVVGVILGAVILKLMPEKLRFFGEYRLLIFGLVLILMMRFRPEGLVPSRRRQLELHEEDEELATIVEQQHEKEVRA